MNFWYMQTFWNCFESSLTLLSTLLPLCNNLFGIKLITYKVGLFFKTWFFLSLNYILHELFQHFLYNLSDYIYTSIIYFLKLYYILGINVFWSLDENFQHPCHITKEELSLKVSFLSGQHVKINVNFKILFSYWLKFNFWLISTYRLTW